MEKRKALIKWFFYAALLWLFTILQMMVFPHLRLMGVSPSLIPMLAAIVAVFEGPVGGGAYGFAAGLLLDAFYYPPEGFYTLLLMLGAMVFGVLAQQALRKTLITSLICSLAMLAVLNLLYFMIFLMITGRSGPSALLTVSLPEILYSMPFSIPLYFLCRGIYCRWGENNQ